MLRVKHSFLFPEIKPIGPLKKAVYSSSESEVMIKGGSQKIERFKDLDGYILDWSSVDKIKEDKFNCWASNNLGMIGSFVPTIPLEYKWVEDLKFMIPDTYLSEIRRNCHRASEEWNIRRSFDTCVREACLTPAIEHIFVAFYLLGDCVYNEKSFGYDHDFPYACILAYKFWMYQTGGGLVWDHSHGGRIDWCISQVDKSIWRDACVRWKKAVDQHYDEWERNCQPKSKEA